MKIIIDTPENIARLAAERYVELLKRKPNAVLGHATGSTPLGLYGELIRLNSEGVISYQDALSFNLDEYVGLTGAHPQSYRYFMDYNFFDRIDIKKENTFVPSGIDTSEAALAGYDKVIEDAGGIDIQLIGVGVNGHFGFNEPGTPFSSKTHVVELTESTREVNSRFFAPGDEMPTHAVTMGIKTVMASSRSIIFMATGKAKAPIMREIISGSVTPEVPASVLQLHPDVEIFMDHEAASLL